MSLINTVLLFFIGVLAILFARYVMVKYDYFTGSPVTCGFKTLGSYKLTTTKADLTATGAKGLIYISDLTKWSSISYTRANDSTYSYTDFTPIDLSSVDVKTRINNIMGCNSIPEFSGDVGVNSKTALILCLQSTTTPDSRVFFVKCFVPTSNASDSNIIAGEIAGNTIATYSDTVKPVAIIQGALGTPNTADTYTLSYTLCVAASRPEGFTYTDCCSNAFTSTTAVPSAAMTAADLKTPSQCSADRAASDTSTTTNSNTFDWGGTDQRDPNCKAGKHSVVTGGYCTGSKDTDLYKSMSADNDITTRREALDYLAAKGKSDESDTSWRDRHSSSHGSSGSSSHGSGSRDNNDDNDHNDDEDEDENDSSTGRDNIWNNHRDHHRDHDNSSSSTSNLSDADLAKLKNLLSNNTSPNDFSFPQKYYNNRGGSGSLKPGLSDCQKYYNCKKNDDEDDDYEGQCL